MGNNDRMTELSFSHLIHNLYGSKDYRLIHIHHDFDDAKKYFLKIIKSITYAIEETINITDNHHKQELLDTINGAEKSIKSSKDFNSLDQQMISLQSELLFLLIGCMPHRWQEEKVINYRKIWKLDGCRQIQYVQNSNQKSNVILCAVQDEKYKDTFGSWSDFLYDIYFLQCHNDPDKLIVWFKENHPQIYYDIF